MPDHDLETLAREWNEAASYAEHRPNDDEAWLRAEECRSRWTRADKEHRERGQVRYW